MGNPNVKDQSDNEFTIKESATSINVMFDVNVPANTPAGDIIYIAGNFNFWDPGPGQLGSDGQDHDLPLTIVGFNHCQITLPFTSGENIEYKYTRGSWTEVEKGAAGEEISNRLLTVPGSDYTQSDEVLNWADNSEIKMVTFTVTVPSWTPNSDIIYIAGTFNFWDAGSGDLGYNNLGYDLALSAIGDNQWQVY